jgi:hypothetical protein
MNKSILLSLEDEMITALQHHQYRRLSRAEMVAILRKQAEDHLSMRAGQGDPRVQVDVHGRAVVAPTVRQYISNAIDVLLGPGEDGR